LYRESYSLKSQRWKAKLLNYNLTYIGGQVKGINPSSALPSTVMVDGVLYRFTLRSCESTIKLTDPKAPKSSLYVDLSLYPPGTVIENELHWDGSRVVSKVPIWAHEKWLRKYQNAGDPDGGTITPDEDTEILRDDPSYAPAIADGGKRPCEDHPNAASATAATSGAKTEVGGLNSSTSASAYADPSAYGSEDYPGAKGFEGGQVLGKPLLTYTSKPYCIYAPLLTYHMFWTLYLVLW
ncbi:hypothetical protein M8C21_013268, partial [Ambrosia artemisiifolia]